MDAVSVDLGGVNARVRKLAATQSSDIARQLDNGGVRVVVGTGRLDGPETVVVSGVDGSEDRLPADAVLPGAAGLGGPLGCLNEARFGIIFGSLGAARDSLETALDYAKTREVFDKPLAAYQLTQQKLADMAVELGNGMLLAMHLGRLKEAGTVTPEQISVGKLNNVRKSLAIAREARTILGANGISLEYSPIRHAANLESVLTYEGTTEVHTLVIGKALTGENAFN